MDGSFVAAFDPNEGKLEFHAFGWNNAFDGAWLGFGLGLVERGFATFEAGVDDSGLIADAS